MAIAFRCAEAVGALSLACDLGAGLAAETSMRIAVIAARTAALLDLDAATQRDAYFAGALRLLGCTGFAAEQAALNGGDDIGFIRNYADIDLGRPREVLARTLRTLNAAASPLSRAASLARFLRDPGLPARISAAHCSAAVMLAGKLGMSAGVQKALAQIYLRWDGQGGGPRGQAIDPVARILHAAQVAEIHHRLAGQEGALAELDRRRLGQLAPEVADAMKTTAAALFAGLDEPSIWEQFLAAEARPWRSVTEADRRAIATGFAHFADLKSPRFLGHSPSVAALATAAAARLGLDRAGCNDLMLAGLLHDIGRVSVPNALLEKPAPSGRGEHERIMAIPHETMRILRLSGLLAPLAGLAGTAFEHLDGSGYPRQLSGAALPLAARCLAAADAYVRVQADPHLAPHDRAAAGSRAVMALTAQGALDPRAAEAVLAAATGANVALSRALPDGLSARGRGPAPGGARSDQSRDRPASCPVFAHGAKPCRQHLWQDRRAQPFGCRALCGREKPDLIRQMADGLRPILCQSGPRTGGPS